MNDHILMRVEQGVAHITLNDPPSLNAITMDMASDLVSAFATAEAAAHVIILSGSGRAFCSGANLTGGAGLGSDSSDPASPLRTHFDPVIAAIRDLSIPLITRVQGPAVGYGASLALAGDIIIASDSAYFQQIFSRIGLVPDGGIAFTLVQAIGRVRATGMMLLGDRISANEALAWGLITQVVPADAIDESVATIAEKLATGPTLALGRTRQMAWAACSGDLDAAFALEIANQRDMLSTQDHRNALAAFAEKRVPVFQGL